MSDIPAHIDPAIAELFKKLPEPGTVFTAERRVHWLRALEGIFGLVYGGVPPLQHLSITRGDCLPDPPP